MPYGSSCAAPICVQVVRERNLRAPHPYTSSAEEVLAFDVLLATEVPLALIPSAIDPMQFTLFHRLWGSSHNMSVSNASKPDCRPGIAFE